MTTTFRPIIALPRWLCASFLLVLLLPNVSFAQTSPPAEAIKARIAWRYDITRLCPELRVADPATGVAVVFLVGASGIASQPAVRASSHSAALDEAALSCIPKLRFQPDTRLGTGEAIQSWQQLSLEWAPTRAGGSTNGPAAQNAPAMSGTANASGNSGPAPRETANPSSPSGSTASRDSSSTRGVPVTVRVCSDDSGKLTQPPAVIRSSGNAAVDQAALKIAGAGASNYRPATSVDGKSLSGCVRLLVEFETW